MAWHEHTGEPNVVLVVPLQDGQQILAVIQSQLVHAEQVLLIKELKTGPSTFTFQGLLGFQGGVQHSYPRSGTGRGGTTTENRQFKTSQVVQCAYLWCPDLD